RGAHAGGDALRRDPPPLPHGELRGRRAAAGYAHPAASAGPRSPALRLARRVRAPARSVDRARARPCPRRPGADLLGDEGMTDMDRTGLLVAIKSAVA